MGCVCRRRRCECSEDFVRPFGATVRINLNIWPYRNPNLVSSRRDFCAFSYFLAPFKPFAVTVNDVSNLGGDANLPAAQEERKFDVVVG